MKVLLINNCYPNGSTGKIVKGIRNGLIERGDEAIVAFAWGNKERRGKGIYKYGVNAEKYISAGLTRVDGNHFGYAWLSTIRLISIIEREKPDIVNIHCANCYSCNHYMLFWWCKKRGYKVVVSEHGEYYYTGNCSYTFECEKWQYGCGKCPDKRRAVKSKVFDFTDINWKRMYRAFQDWNDRLFITCVSEWQMKKSLMSPITKRHKHFCIHNGINMSDFMHISKLECRDEFCRDMYGKYILFVTPGYMMEEVKGGKYVLAIADRLKDVNIIVVGSTPVVHASPNIRFIPHTEDKRHLSEFYSAAKLTLLTSRTETFSLVTAESFSCGTPVVGFKCGGAENIALSKYSEFVEYGNIDLLEQKIREFMQRDWDKIEISEAARREYEMKKMADGYLKVYEEIDK